MSLKNTIIFFSSIIFGIIFTAVAFFLIINFKALPNQSVSELDYRNMLFKNVPSPRLIIDSGSNSYWSVIPKILEDKFHMPTFVVAENGNVPFDMKLNRIRAFAKPGDIILMPLEWLYYSRKDYNSDFIESVFAIKKSDNKEHNILYNYTYHYYMLPIISRIKFVLEHTNPSYIVRAITERYLEPSIQKQILVRTRSLIYNYANNYAGDVKNDANRLQDTSTLKLNCHQYLNAIPLTDLSQLKKITNQLSQLQNEKHIKVIITWPAVSGADCYIPEEVRLLEEQIKNQSIEKGLAVIGSALDSSFTENHMLDTYYHVDSEAALLRTNHLANKLEEIIKADVTKDFSKGIKYYATELFQSQILDIYKLAASNLRQLTTGNYMIQDPDFYEYFYLSPFDWYDEESWGRWSKGDKSRITMRSSNKDCQILIHGKNFASSYSDLRIYSSGSQNLSVISPINIEKDKGEIQVELYQKNTTSPKSLGVSDDTRSLGFGLEGIIVNCK